MTAYERLARYAQEHGLGCEIVTPVMDYAPFDVIRRWKPSGEVIVTIAGQTFTACDPGNVGAACEAACQQALAALGATV